VPLQAQKHINNLTIPVHGQAVVWVYRWDKAKNVSVPVLVNGQSVGHLGTMQRLAITLPAGDHQVNSMVNGMPTPTVNLNLAPGSVSHFKMVVEAKRAMITNLRMDRQNLNKKWIKNIGTDCIDVTQFAQASLRNIAPQAAANERPVSKSTRLPLCRCPPRQKIFR